MLSPRWRKVLRDLWTNKTRTILVVASIAVGIFAVGTVQQLRTVILGEMQTVYDESNAAQAVLYTAVDETMLDVIRKMPEVDEAEGRGSIAVQIQIGTDQWEMLNVVAVEDFEDIQIDKLKPVYSMSGNPEIGAERTRWPGKDEIVLERGALQANDTLPADLRVGDAILLETPQGRQRSVTLTGLVYDPNAFPAAFTGSATGYVTFDTYERLGGSHDYSQVNLRVNGTPEQLQDKQYITEAADAVAAKIEKDGRTVPLVQIPDPGQLRLQDLFDSLALLLTPLGLLALILSGFLVINTISALMAQQVRQIGVMKAIGARRYQVTGLYLGSILIYSLLALMVAIPLTAVVSGAIAQFLGSFINVSFPFLALPLNVLLIEIAIGILVPLLAALYPVLKGTAITVREALSDFGTGDNSASTGRFTSLLFSIRGISRPLQLSLRNTFRRRSRLALTLFTLIMGGMIFMTVGSVRLSLDNLIEEALAYNQFDVQVSFERSYRTAQVENVVAEVPGVGVIESWGSAQVTRVRPDGSESDPITLSALPANSPLVQPTLIDGRWILPGDENAVVISQNVLSAEPDIKVGEPISLEIDGKETEWVVVGIAQVLGGPRDGVPAYVNYPYFAHLTGSVDRAASVQVQRDPEFDITNAELAESLESELDAAGLRVASVFTVDRIRDLTGGFFDIIVYLLLTMGTLIAAVGALGLMGTMSTNVLERTREIGVMRAIGASDGAVQRIVVVEGMIIGAISWIAGALLAYPAGAALSSAVGQVLFETPLPYSFSVNGVLTWFGIVAVLAAAASFLPAWNASRLTVREVLAYE